MCSLSKYVSVIGLLLVYGPALAQSDSNYVGSVHRKIRRAKAIYVEALGSSGFSTSLNYDMRFRPGHKGWGFRVGATYPYREGRTSTYSLPIMLNRVSGNERIAIEAGVGLIVAYRRQMYYDQNFVVQHENSVSYPAVANIGLRFQPLRTGIVWRIYWAPNWEFSSSKAITLTWIGTSLGIGF